MKLRDILKIVEPIDQLRSELDGERREKFDEFYKQNKEQIEYMGFVNLMSDPFSQTYSENPSGSTFAEKSISQYLFLQRLEKRLYSSNYKLDLNKVKL